MRTITAANEIDRLFAGGRRVSDPALLVLADRTPAGSDPAGRMLFVAGKRLGPAVRRNRAKRVLRELTRRAGGPWPGWDVALVARGETGIVRQADLESALVRALDALGILR
ncbi:MAG: ribonuclease P protein component [Actinobacteria bacterium]|nr:ribonuclease P protein component [Actinomycetota bacterium]